MKRIIVISVIILFVSCCLLSACATPCGCWTFFWINSKKEVHLFEL